MSMKKNIILTSIAIACLAVPAVVMALPIQYDYDEIVAFDTDSDASTYGFGTQIGGVEEYVNNTVSFAVVQTLVDAYFDTVLDFARIEEEDYTSPLLEAVGYDGEGSSPEDIFLSSTYGGWAVSEGLEPGIDVWMIKAGGYFTLWTYGMPSMEGYWTTAGLTVGNNSNQPEISHFTAYVTESTPIPEPATMLLFGTGLAGIAGVHLRKNKFAAQFSVH